MLVLTFLILTTWFSCMATAQTITCPELAFSTETAANVTTEYVEGDGLYIYTQKEGYIPYILVYVNATDTRVTDPDTYISEVLVPR